MYKVIFIDIDGTLRNDNKIITERTINSIKKICSLGIYVILCTGRPRYYTEPLSRNCGASNYIITSGGAEVYDYQEKKVIYSNPMNSDSCHKLYDLAQQYGIKIVMNFDETKVVNCLYPLEEKEIPIPKEVDQFLLKNKIIQCIILDNNYNKMKNMQSFIDNIDGVKINNQSKSFINSYIEQKGIFYYDIAEYNTSKGNGIKALCKYLNIELFDTIGIGDDYNDLSMFEVVGHSVAMGNANDDIKKITNEVIKSNNENGLAEYLENLYNNYIKGI